MEPLGIALAVVTLALVAGFLWLGHREHQRGDDALQARAAQLEAEFLNKLITRERDDALTEAAKAVAVAKLAVEKMEAAEAALREQVTKTEKLIKERIDAANGDDLVDLSGDVFGGVRPMPDSGDTNHPTAPGGDAHPAPVLDRR